jgi:hypothetical protein
MPDNGSVRNNLIPRRLLLPFLHNNRNSRKHDADVPAVCNVRRAPALKAEVPDDCGGDRDAR